MEGMDILKAQFKPVQMNEKAIKRAAVKQLRFEMIEMADHAEFLVRPKIAAGLRALAATLK
jgi:hypothetical protein